MHERYRELCAAASIGEAAPEELAELEMHLSRCGQCRQLYSDFLNIAAHQYSQRENLDELTSAEIDRLLGFDGMREKFQAAAAEQRIPSGQAAPGGAAAPRSFSQNRYFPQTHSVKRAAAAVAVAAVIAVSFQVGRQYVQFQQSSQPPPIVGHAGARDDASARLSLMNATLEQDIQRLKADLLRTQKQLAHSKRDQPSPGTNDARLLSARDFTIHQLQQELADSELVANSAREELDKLRTRSADSQASFIADESRIHELSDQLAQKTAALQRDHQLMQEGRDIRDLMVARNLHIVDVFDTDARGKTKPAFGRIFLTEGKSLVFYAYDLNESKLAQANYHYRVWGAKEGQDERARSLGIFYSDDKTERRWVFKCDDAKILSEIDSVFVTLEPPGSDATHPRGQRMMDAYLRGLPNHP
jgi:hypothetical protein